MAGADLLAGAEAGPTVVEAVKMESKTEIVSEFSASVSTADSGRSTLPARRKRLGYSSWTEVSALVAAHDAEAKALLAFRDAVADNYEVDPNTAARFVRARKPHVDKSVKMFVSEREWRAAESVDTALTEPGPEPWAETELVARFAPKLLDALDKQGRPIVFCAVGELDVGALNKKGVSLQMLIRRAVRESERVRIAIEQSANPLAGHLLIQDIRTCTVGKFLRSRHFFNAQAKLSQDYYPELLGQLLVLRGPPAAAWAVAQVKRFLDKDTAAKIRLESGDPRGPLLEYVSEEVADQIIGMLP